MTFKTFNVHALQRSEGFLVSRRVYDHASTFSPLRHLPGLEHTVPSNPPDPAERYCRITSSRHHQCTPHRALGLALRS
jgi:hypothetical protein